MKQEDKGAVRLPTQGTDIQLSLLLIQPGSESLQ